VERLPLTLAKRILLHVLRGIEHAHRAGMVHTDLKYDNIFFDVGMSTEDIQEVLDSEPPKTHPRKPSQDEAAQAAVSQPLPLPSLEEAGRLQTFVVADFGNGEASLIFRAHKRPLTHLELTRRWTPPYGKLRPTPCDHPRSI
jgi:serine/threonine protein kinase